MPPASCAPLLTDGVVTLRPHRLEDVPRIVEQCTDPESVRWTTVPVPYDEGMAREWVASITADWKKESGPFIWAVTAADDPDGLFLGSIDVRPEGAGIASTGFGLHPEGRGRHLMAGALRLVTRWWFDRGGVRMTWKANRGNFASWRVAWACGFTVHGTRPQWIAHRDEALDEWSASIGRDGDLTTPATPWHEPVVMERNGIRLRPFRDEDIEAVEEPDFPLHFEPPGAPMTREGFPAWLLRRREREAQGSSTTWGVADAETDRALGEAILMYSGQEPGCAEVGYGLFSTARGRGAATTATQLMVEHAFTPEADGGLGLRRLSAFTVGDNVASARVLERVGFTEWGREPAFCEREDGSLDDGRHFVLLRDSRE